MAIKQGVAKKDHFNMNGILIAGVIYIVTAIAATALCASLVDKELLDEKNAHLYAMAILLVASAIGTWSKRERNILANLVQGTVYIAITLLISVLLFEIRFQGIKEGGLAILLGSILCCLTGIKQRKKVPKYRSKK